MVRGRFGLVVSALAICFLVIAISNQLVNSKYISNFKQVNGFYEQINKSEGEKNNSIDGLYDSQSISPSPITGSSDIENRRPMEQSYNGYTNPGKDSSGIVTNSFKVTKIDSSEEPRIRISWNGLDIFSAANSSFGYVRPVNPPDVAIAAGKDDVVQIVHSSIGIWNKDGIPLKTESLFDFFKVNRTHFIADPRIIYDSTSGRWFATLIDGGLENETGKTRYTCHPDACKIKIAISNTTDPTRPWQIKEIDSRNAGYFPDQPKLIASKLNFTISANEFLPNKTMPDQHTAVVLDKSVLINNNTQLGKVANMTFKEPQNPIPSITPSKCFSTISVIKDIKSNKSNEFSNVTGVEIFDFCNPADVINYYHGVVKLESNLSAAPRFEQPVLVSTTNYNSLKSDQSIIKNDTLSNDKMEVLILSSIRNQSSIWIALHSACTPFGTSDHSCVNILRFDNVSDPDLGYKYKQSENTQYSISGTDVYYPAMGISKSGKLFFISGFSNSSTYPSLIISHLISENKTKDKILALGSNINNSSSYGDYFGSAIDPVDGSVWLSGEYVNRSISVPKDFPTPQSNNMGNWSTIIANVS